MKSRAEQAIEEEFYERKKAVYRSGESDDDIQIFSDFARGVCVMAKIQGDDTTSLEKTIEGYREQLKAL